jgi:hypothetical protein
VSFFIRLQIQLLRSRCSRFLFWLYRLLRSNPEPTQHRIRPKKGHGVQLAVPGHAVRIVIGTARRSRDHATIGSSNRRNDRSRSPLPSRRPSPRSPVVAPV